MPLEQELQLAEPSTASEPSSDAPKSLGQTVAAFLLRAPSSPRFALLAAVAATTSAAATVALVIASALNDSPVLYFTDDELLNARSTGMTTLAPPNESVGPSIFSLGSLPPDQRVDYIAHVFVMPFLLVVGFINQTLNVWTLSAMPSVGYIYLKASAIADICSIFALIPFCLRHAQLSDEHNYWIQFYHAHLELPLINSFITASALCLVAMTVDRWLSIKYPITFHNSPGTRHRVWGTVALLYIVAFGVFLPSGVQKTLFGRMDPNDRHHRTVWTVERNHNLNLTGSFKIYLMFREVVARIGPIIVLTLLNSYMVYSLYNLNGTRIGSSRREKDRTRIFALLLISSVTFVICTFPASMLSLFIDHANRSFGMQVFRAFANCLQVSHYLPHLYFYMLCSTEYHNAFLKLFGCDKPRSNQTTVDSPTVRHSSTILGRVRSFHYFQSSRRNGTHLMGNPRAKHSVAKYHAPNKIRTSAATAPPLVSSVEI